MHTMISAIRIAARCLVAPLLLMSVATIPDVFAEPAMAQAIEAERAPVPPGVDPARLRAGGEDDRAQMSLGDALAQLVPPLPEAATRTEARGERRRRALRHYLRGRDAMSRSLYLMAITEFELALGEDPDSPDILRRLGQAYIAHGQTARGVDRYTRLLNYVPDDGEALLFLGLEAANRQDLDTAVVHLGRLRAIGIETADDMGASILTNFWLWRSFERLGYDHAGIQLANAVLMEPLVVPMRSRYNPQLASISRQRSLIWQAIGDAYCRLDRLGQARQAYASAGTFPTSEPTALLARQIYVALTLGDAESAESLLVDALGDSEARIDEGVIQLCGYLYDHGGESTLRRVLQARRAASPDRVDLARAAAQVLPRAEAADLLRDLLAHHPDDRTVLGQLLADVIADDLIDACHLVIDLVADDPSRAEPAVRQLIARVPDPVEIRTALGGIELSPARAIVECYVLRDLGGIGEAWWVAQDALRAFPDDGPLRIMPVMLAADLQDPGLVRTEIDRIADLTSAWSYVVRSVALRTLEAFDRASLMAESAVDRDAGFALGHAELARVRTERALRIADDDASGIVAASALESADRALALDPGDESMLELIARLYGPNGMLSDVDLFREHLRALRDRDPQPALFGRLVADDAIRQQRFEQARQRLLPLYQRDPSDAGVVQRLVTTWMSEGTPRAALAWLEQQMTQRPGNPTLWRWWTQVTIGSGEIDAAIIALEDRLADQPDDYTARQLLEAAYRRAERPDDAIPLSLARLDRRPDGPRTRLERVALFGAAERPAEARPHLEWLLNNATTLDPTQLETAVRLARRLGTVDPGMMPLTLELVERTVRLHPSSPLQVYGIGMIALIAMDRPRDEFDALVQRARQQVPGLNETALEGLRPYRDLAQAMIDAGYPEAAGRVLRDRWANGPRDEQSTLFLGKLIVGVDIAADDAAAAIAFVESLAAAGPIPNLFMAVEPASDVGTALFDLSTMFALAGRTEGAELILRRVLRDDRTNATAMNNLAFGRIDRGLSDPETISLIERAWMIEPSSDFIADTLGWLRYLQGKFADDDGALALVKRAVDAADEPSAEVLEHLGDIWWRLGEPEKAERAWRRVARELGAQDHRARWVSTLLRLQRDRWLLVVDDPEAMYDRDFGQRYRRVMQKLDALESGGEPAVTPTFAERAERTGENDGRSQ